MHGLFGERGTPDFLAACPVLRLNQTAGVALFMLHGVTEKERGEWERLLTLAEPIIIIGIALLVTVIILSVVLMILESNNLAF